MTLELGDTAHLLSLDDLVEDTDYDALDLDRPSFEICGYGFRWLRARRDDTPIASGGVAARPG